MNRRLLSLLAACVAVTGAACTSSAPPPAAPANADLTIEGKDIDFDKDDYTATAGEVKIAYISKGNLVHNLIIEDANKVKLTPKLKVGPGETTGGTYTLAAGTYSVYCDISGHKQSMNAKLVVS
jgi:plastocyanin